MKGEPTFQCPIVDTTCRMSNYDKLLRPLAGEIPFYFRAGSWPAIAANHGAGKLK
jgi:hypothetical protein